MLDKRNLHLRLQEYCDCYMETDPKAEMEAMLRGGTAQHTSGDPEESALKFLALAILYALKESARRISFSRTEDGTVNLNVEATGKYRLPPPEGDLAEHVFVVTRGIMHLESERASETLPLGIGNDRVELQVEFKKEAGKETMSISLPTL